ncbi:uncharacterized protein ASCRUDRAFT_80074 [Ascoidea rubescens DSM 1968]|uniref:Chitin synthase export chaperone n=1 Tax=Ascoidea rubescens DSM 1968 TaxID=1344418 RepID=A0A1D2VM27_9ASCO|nr:hypothetical protein ASCRUDRAFT_80074 [Ascoidea rubescens DSM 1968]ODV62605.1 hypothetical protein ASCRUDRAFT_80074 [Ascoidea rubescens DSM 1968]
MLRNLLPRLLFLLFMLPKARRLVAISGYFALVMMVLSTLGMQMTTVEGYGVYYNDMCIWSMLVIICLCCCNSAGNLH